MNKLHTSRTGRFQKMSTSDLMPSHHKNSKMLLVMVLTQFSFSFSEAKFRNSGRGFGENIIC